MPSLIDYDNTFYSNAIKNLDDIEQFCQNKSENDILQCRDYIDKRITKSIAAFIKQFHYGLSFYRLRKAAKNESFKQVSDISYIPVGSRCNIGRMNLPNQSVFYASFGLETCINELKLSETEKKDGVVIYCGEWRVNTGECLNLLPILSPNPELMADDYILQDQEFVHTISSICPNFFPNVDVDLVIKYYRSLGRLFLGDNYVTSSIIANHLFSIRPVNGEIDGIIYPSFLRNDVIVYDLALKPSSVDKKVICLNAKKGVYTENLGNGILTDIAFAEVENCKLNWFKINSSIEINEICDIVFNIELESIININDLKHKIIGFLNQNKERIIDFISNEENFNLAQTTTDTIRHTIYKKWFDAHTPFVLGIKNLNCKIEISKFLLRYSYKIRPAE